MVDRGRKNIAKAGIVRELRFSVTALPRNISKWARKAHENTEAHEERKEYGFQSKGPVCKILYDVKVFFCFFLFPLG